MCKTSTHFLILFAFVTPCYADLDQWLEEVDAGTPATFFITNVADIPTTVDIGPISGDRTYEFVVRGAPTEVFSASLMGIKTPTGGWGIKFDQFFRSGQYGITGFLSFDYRYPVPTHFNVDVHLTFVAANSQTLLFVNGLEAASTAYLEELNGCVGLGGNVFEFQNDAYDDPFHGIFYGAATYDSALSPDEILNHAEAFFGGKLKPLLGDVNLDGNTDLLDVSPFVLLLSGGFQIEADINVDGIVDLQDVGPFVDLLTRN